MPPPFQEEDRCRSVENLAPGEKGTIAAGWWNHPSKLGRGESWIWIGTWRLGLRRKRTKPARCSNRQCQSQTRSFKPSARQRPTPTHPSSQSPRTGRILAAAHTLHARSTWMGANDRYLLMDRDTRSRSISPHTVWPK